MRRSLVVLTLLGCLDPGDPQFNTLQSAPFVVIGSQPMADATGVATDSAVDLDLSDVPWPADLPVAWDLHTGNLHTTGTASADLVDRFVRIRAARGMLPEVLYTVTLSSKLHSFGGAALATKQIRFQTGRFAGGAPTPPPTRSLRNDVVPALSPCATCHGGGSPAQGLDLSTAAGIEAAVGMSSKVVAENVLISPGNHAVSYLMWKALGLPRTYGHQADTVPPLAHDAARVLADWIDEGAGDD